MRTEFTEVPNDDTKYLAAISQLNFIKWGLNQKIDYEYIKNLLIFLAAHADKDGFISLPFGLTDREDFSAYFFNLNSEWRALEQDSIDKAIEFLIDNNFILTKKLFSEDKKFSYTIYKLNHEDSL